MNLINLTEPLFDHLEMITKTVSTVSLQTIKPETVHKTRVACRKSLALIWLLESTREFTFRQLRKTLNSIIKILGEIRDLDVAFENAKHFNIDCKQLLSRRDKKATQTLKILKQLDISSLHLKSSNVNFQRSKSFRIPRKRLRQKADKWFSKSQLNDKDFHRNRIYFKKIRYILEALDQKAESIKLIQSDLGKAHDLKILKRYVEVNRAVKKQKFKELKKAKKLFRPAVKSIGHILHELN